MFLLVLRLGSCTLDGMSRTTQVGRERKNWTLLFRLIDRGIHAASKTQQGSSGSGALEQPWNRANQAGSQAVVVQKRRHTQNVNELPRA